MEEFDLETPLPINLNESEAETRIIMSSLLDMESDHMPCTSSSSSSSSSYPQNYINIRGQIMPFLISNSSPHEKCNDRFLSYLAVNYLDRFLSTQPPILEEKPWILRLVAFSCLSLAMKMKGTTDSASDLKIQVHDGGVIIFDSRTVKRMEFLILDSLKWRMRSVTPFCFINFFISLFKFKDPPSTKALKSRAIEIILTAQNDTTSLEFRPSIISASALLSASHELFPLQFPSFRQAILDCPFVNKESFGKCYNVLQDIIMEGYNKSVLELELVTSSTTSTPANVLDLECCSTSSSDNELTQQCKKKKKKTRTVTEEDSKRRKIGSPENTYKNQFFRTKQF